MSRLANVGRGRYYFTDHPEDIPRVITREANIATRSAVSEGAFRAVPGEPSPLLRGVDASAAPPLLGYVATTPKPRSTVALVSPSNDPLLAHANYGLGRVVAWTADVGNTWGGGWLQWTDAGPFFAQAVRWSLAAAGDPSLRLEARVDDDQVTLTAERLADDGAFLDGLDTRVAIVAPDGQAREVVLPQVRPGVYERSIGVDEAGLYRAIASETTIGFTIDDRRETRAVGTNHALLAGLAARTNGRALDEPAQAFERDVAPRDVRWVPIWPWLLLAGLAAFVVEIAVRRLALPRLPLHRLGPALLEPALSKLHAARRVA
jgi:hypothetical protein